MMKARGYNRADNEDVRPNRRMERGSAGSLEVTEKGGLRERDPSMDTERRDQPEERGSGAGAENIERERVERVGNPDPTTEKKPGFDRGDLPAVPDGDATGVRVDTPGLKPKIANDSSNDPVEANIGAGNTRGPSGIGGSEALGTDGDISTGAVSGHAARNPMDPDSELYRTSRAPETSKDSILAPNASREPQSESASKTTESRGQGAAKHG